MGLETLLINPRRGKKTKKRTARKSKSWMGLSAYTKKSHRKRTKIGSVRRKHRRNPIASEMVQGLIAAAVGAILTNKVPSWIKLTATSAGQALIYEALTAAALFLAAKKLLPGSAKALLAGGAATIGLTAWQQYAPTSLKAYTPPPVRQIAAYTQQQIAAPRTQLSAIQGGLYQNRMYPNA